MKSICKSRFRRWPAWAGGDDFRRRAGSALIHPATVAALGVLLLNDLLFKALWPQAWLTGKLSDLAWLVFALPLLAFLLSFAVRGDLRARRVAFLVAYVGLPLLYAAFNTFDPVHDWIMRGISIAGGAAGSPRDATDSLVIPLAWAAALWVWRRQPAAPGAMRLRWAVLVAGVAALASVATSPPDTLYGVQHVGISEDGSIVADADFWAYRSVDGGLSWSQIEGWPWISDEVEWGGQSVETPRGRYSLDGPRVMRVGTDDTQAQAVYSTEYLQEQGNVWVQRVATEGYNDLREIATRPLAVVYDERSGNVVLALGIQGAVIGTSDGKWTPVAVGRLKPTDFSYQAKTRLLFSDLGFWAASLGLSLAMTGMALIASQHRREYLLQSVFVGPFIGIAVIVVAWAPSILLILLIVAILPLPTMAYVILAMVIIPLVATFVVESKPRRSEFWNLGVIGIGSLAILTAAGVAVTFGLSGDGTVDDTGSSELVRELASVLALLLASTTIAVSWRLLARHWIVVAGSLVTSMGLVVLSFMLWLHLGITDALTKFAAIALCGVVAILLARYVSHITHVEGPLCATCRKPTTALYTGCTNCGAKLAES